MMQLEARSVFRSGSDHLPSGFPQLQHATRLAAILVSLRGHVEHQRTTLELVEGGLAQLQVVALAEPDL